MSFNNVKWHTSECNSHYEKFADGRVVCIDDEIPFEIPAGWEWCRFSQLYWQLTDGTHSTPKYTESGIPFVSVKDMSSGELSLANTKYISEEEHNVLITRCNPQPGDLLLSKVGTTGVPAIVKTERPFSLFVSVALIKFFPQILSSDFLITLINSPLVQEQARNNTRGVGNKNWVLTAISSTLMAIPPFQEQLRIIAKINELKPFLDHYENSQNRLDILNGELTKRLNKSILQEAIQGKLVPQSSNDEPAIVLLRRIKDEKQKLFKEGKIKKKDIEDCIIFKGEDNKYYEKIGGKCLDISEEIPFDLPESWAWSRLAVIVHYRIGKTPTRGETAFWESGTIPWVSISDMKEYGLVTQTREKVTPKATSLFGQISGKGTLLMSFKLTVGRTAILDIDAYHNEAIISIWPYVDEEALKHYLFYALPLLANLGDSKDAIKGKTLNTNSINNLLIPIPPSKEQIAIVKKIEELYTRL